VNAWISFCLETPAEAAPTPPDEGSVFSATVSARKEVDVRCDLQFSTTGRTRKRDKVGHIELLTLLQTP
jgi:hypothetical protein